MDQPSVRSTGAPTGSKRRPEEPPVRRKKARPAQGIPILQLWSGTAEAPHSGLGAFATAEAPAPQPSLAETELETEPDTGAPECPVCISVLCEPVTTSCKHSFCRLCFLKATERNPQCPMCRRPLSGDALVPDIDQALWDAVRAHSGTSTGRALDAATLHQMQQAEALANERRRQQGRLELQRLMLTELRRLPGDYEHLLNEELARNDPLERCDCPERFVCVRRSASSNGRSFWSCPLFFKERENACRFYKNVI